MSETQKHRRTERFRITGIVQGVGFRPFVHRTALRHHLGGYILNDPEGVEIEVQGPPMEIDAFAHGLSEEAPPLARIAAIERTIISESDSTPHHNGFHIRESARNGRARTLISPDMSICDDCLAEMFDPADRRFLYPFINCTNCGPRFTIIKGLPYDRPFTTMAGFTMCPNCHGEYTDPANRRFHAQPNACPVCGPQVSLMTSRDAAIPGDPVLRAIELLRAGKILAIKGLGGFHLSVDGSNPDAVARLRNRKHREEKPLALMTGTLDGARMLVTLGPAEERMLTSPERPILLAPRLGHIPAADNVAPGNDHLGIMLPYTPLHYLLLFHPGAGGDFAAGRATFPCLVMTSGNISDEPICRTNDDAFERLAGIADAFLVHDRDIHVRCDDSVVRSVRGDISFIRRSRGYVPVPVFLPKPARQVMAFGGELKNTLCLTDGRRAFMSQHIGDLENMVTLDMFREAAAHFRTVLEIKPKLFAHDPHPNYLATRYFMELRETLDPSVHGAVAVQHHHAHIASVLAEHGREEPVIGFAMDGTGYGLDGKIWGGEILVADRTGFTRAAHLGYIPLPGGDAAIREPWRTAFAYLRAAYGDNWRSLDLPALLQADVRTLDLLDRACAAGINAPDVSSLGRLFDAAASILDIKHTAAFEGQAAIMLDMIAHGAGIGNIMPYNITETTPLNYPNYPERWGTLAGVDIPPAPVCPAGFEIDLLPVIMALVDGVRKRTPREKLARDFHATLLALFLDMAERIRDLTGIGTVVVSGGSWQNRIFSERFPDMIRTQGFEYLDNSLVPPNDGGIALGQAYVASGIAEATAVI